MPLYTRDPHPHVELRKQAGPVKVNDQRPRNNPIERFNARVGLLITVIVGTMWCAYLFTVIAFVSLPDAINSGESLVLIAWIAQTFLQLVLLPIIIVGQNIQAKAADGRAEQTYKDAEAVLHEAEQIQSHLAAQDHALERMVDKLGVALNIATA
jgi:uncharacterized membrane protein